MTTAATDLAELGRARDGSLAKTPFPVLLQALFAAERTAVVELKQKNLEKRISFEDGVPIDCDSNLLHEMPARFLADKGKLTEEQYQKALTESALAGERVEQTLLRLQFVSPFELFKLLQQNLAYKILDCFCLNWADAKFKILAEPPDVSQPLRVNLPQLVYTGVSTFAPFSVVETGVSALAGKKLGLVPSPPHELKSLKLSAKDTRLFNELKKQPTLDGLCADLKLPLEEALRKVWALYVLGYLDVAERLQASSARVEEVAAPVVAVAAEVKPQGPSAEEVEKLRNEVTAAYMRYRTQDPFDLFGLDEKASANAVRDAYLVWSEKFAPWRYKEGELAGMADRARDLFLFGAKAWAQLADPEQRTQVIRRREAARENKNRKRSTDFSIKTNLLDARSQHDEGMRRLGANDARAAVNYLEFAADCEPRNATYKAHLAYARFMHDPHAFARQSIAELDEATRIDPACGEAFYLAGEIFRWGGDLDRAEDAYRKASKLMPGDRRPVDAIKTVVTARGKK